MLNNMEDKICGLDSNNADDKTLEDFAICR
jgi:hypothetical protein